MKRRIVALILAAGLAAALGGALPSGADARDRDRHDKRHAPRVEKRHHRPQVVVREGPRHAPAPRVAVRHDYRHAPAPRVIYREAWCPPPRVVVQRPWYSGARYVVVDDEPFYFHAGLGIFLGGIGLHIDIRDGLPPGYAWYDPYCGEYYYSVDSYHRHLRRYGHPAALQVIEIEEGW